MNWIWRFKVFLKSIHEYNDYDLKFNDAMSGKCKIKCFD